MLIIHFTTAHTRTDVRIREKQTTSLARETNVKVALFVQDGRVSEICQFTGIQVVNTGLKAENRLARMTIGAWRMWKAVRKARPAVAHFHDPELIPVGLALRLSGIKIVYDVHEDVPRQILSKFYLPIILRKSAAWSVKAMEWIAGWCFDAIVSATPKIAERFSPDKTVVIQNFPILEELVAPDSMPYDKRPPHFAYVGGITKERGAIEMVEAIAQVPLDKARLCLAGAFSPESLHSEIESLSGWDKVDFLGWLGRENISRLLAKVRAGLVVLHPVQRYQDSYPVKMFEYMAAGLPVIASDFPLWKEIVGGAGCGLLVNPLDPNAIAEAMQWILGHPAESEAMGKRGRHAVEEKYNWEKESEKLVSLYDRLINE